MKRVTIVPEGWACTLEECPPGHFMYGDMLGFKSEYSTKVSKDDEPLRYRVDSYCDSGETFCPGEAEDTIVQPVAYVIEDVEE